MDSLCIVMPAYNEEENIEDVIRTWYPVLSGKGEKSEFVINISGCTDGTEKKILALKTEFPLLKILKDSENSYGSKVLDLYRYGVSYITDSSLSETSCTSGESESESGNEIHAESAMESGNVYIFQTDSDGQTSPSDFSAFWELRKEYDAVIGSRSKREDGKGRLFVEKVVVLLISVFFKTGVPDANAPFRLMKENLLKKYLAIVPKDYSMPNILFTALFSSCGEKICFREISFGRRCAGKNTMNYRKIFAAGLESLSTFRNLGRKYRAGK